jgi:hypothetical protein
VIESKHASLHHLGLLWTLSDRDFSPHAVGQKELTATIQSEIRETTKTYVYAHHFLLLPNIANSLKP